MTAATAEGKNVSASEKISTGRTVTIAPANLSVATRSIESANRRLARAGVDSRFDYTTSERLVPVTEDGITSYVRVIDIELDSPVLSVGGWRFVASVDIVEGGTIVRSAPGADTTGMPVPREHHCDHCRKTRRRLHSYMLHGEDGQWMQVGKSCLAVFLGMTPKGLWALDFDPLAEVDQVDDVREYARTTRIIEFSPRQALSLSWVLSDHGRSFVTRGLARETEGRLTATSDAAAEVMFGARNRIEAQEHIRAAAQVDPEIVDAIMDNARKIDGDYGRNLTVALDSASLPLKHLPLVCSAVKVYVGEIRRKAVEASIVDAPLAPEGEKITDVDGEITVLQYVDTNFGTSCIMVVRTDSGHLVKWFSKAIPDEIDGIELNAGQRIRIAKATVKGYQEYAGHIQTCVVRAKISRP